VTGDVTTAPLAFFAVAVSVLVVPTTRFVTVAGVTLTLATTTGGVGTVTATVAVMPRTVAVMVAEPAPTAVMVPLVSALLTTLATVESDVVQVMAGVTYTPLLWSVVVVTAVAVLPTASVGTDVGLTFT
jgi:hypothetical protein